MLTSIGPDLCRLPGYVMSSVAMTITSGHIALHRSATLMVCGGVGKSGAKHTQRFSAMHRIPGSHRCHTHQLVILLTRARRTSSHRQDDPIQSP